MRLRFRDPAGWPKHVTLSSPAFAQMGEGVRLADGKIVADGGDVALVLAVQLSLVVGDLPDSFCVKGTYETLAAVPANPGSCVDSSGQPDGCREGRLFLSGATIHTNEESSVIGLSALVLNRARDATYRLRMLGDSVLPDEQGESSRRPPPSNTNRFPASKTPRVACESLVGLSAGARGSLRSRWCCLRGNTFSVAVTTIAAGNSSLLVPLLRYRCTH